MYQVPKNLTRQRFTNQLGSGSTWRTRVPSVGLPNSPSRCVASPKPECNRHGIDIETRAPCHLVTMPVKFAMMKATNRDREFTADLAADPVRPGTVRLGEVESGHWSRLIGAPAKLRTWVMIFAVLRQDLRRSPQ
jgi:hypothetical protein